SVDDQYAQHARKTTPNSCRPNIVQRRRTRSMESVVCTVVGALYNSRIWIFTRHAARRKGNAFGVIAGEFSLARMMPSGRSTANFMACLIMIFKSYDFCVILTV